MSRGAPKDPQSSLVMVPRALLGSSAAILAVAAVVNSQGQGGSGPEVVSWMAVAWAAAAPLLATLVRGEGLVAGPPTQGAAPVDLVTRLQKTIVFFGVLESAVVFAAVALIVSPKAWPLLAAVFPLAVMALNLPSRQS
jgi:hypothetical protein